MIFFPCSPEPSIRFPEKTLFPKGLQLDSNYLSEPQALLPHPTQARNHTMFELNPPPLHCLPVRKLSPREGRGLKQGHQAALGQGEGKDGSPDPG